MYIHNENFVWSLISIMERPPQLGGTYFRWAAMFERAFEPRDTATRRSLYPVADGDCFPSAPRKMIAESRRAERVAIIATQWITSERFATAKSRPRFASVFAIRFDRRLNRGQSTSVTFSREKSELFFSQLFYFDFECLNSIRHDR